MGPKSWRQQPSAPAFCIELSSSSSYFVHGTPSCCREVLPFLGNVVRLGADCLLWSVPNSTYKIGIKHQERYLLAGVGFCFETKLTWASHAGGLSIKVGKSLNVCPPGAICASSHISCERSRHHRSDIFHIPGRLRRRIRI